jgi:glucokinase
MQKFLGIDVGGTNVKCGIVTENGQILHQTKFRTDELRESESFVDGLLKIVESQLLEFPEVQFVGIGVPGTLNKARTHTVEIPNIPEFNHVNISERLGQAFPNHYFRLDNDANAAALGEYYFSPEKMPDDFIFVTLGTGVGGAAIIDRQIFKGGGNAMEIGHILSEGGKGLEYHIGKKGMYAMANEALQKYKEKSRLYNEPIINTRLLIESASLGDPLALEVFDRMGYLLGVAMVGIIRVLDIKNIYIGGGISHSFDYMESKLMETLSQNLTPYYVEDLEIKRANLGNDAGLLGAASLSFEHAKQAAV